MGNFNFTSNKASGISNKAREDLYKAKEEFLLRFKRAPVYQKPIVVASQAAKDFIISCINVIINLFSVAANIAAFALAVAVTPVVWLGVGIWKAASFLGSCCCGPRVSKTNKINCSEVITAHGIDAPEKPGKDDLEKPQVEAAYAKIADLTVRNLRQKHKVQFAYFPKDKTSLTIRQCEAKILELLKEYFRENNIQLSEILTDPKRNGELKSFATELGNALNQSQAINSKSVDTEAAKSAIKQVIEVRSISNASNKAPSSAEIGSDLNSSATIIEEVKPRSPFAARIQSASQDPLNVKAQGKIGSQVNAVTQRRAEANQKVNCLG